MSADNKKVRPANLTAAEKEFLVDLALKYQTLSDLEVLFQHFRGQYKWQRQHYVSSK